MQVSVFFRQPLDLEGRWVPKDSIIGSTEATLYPSPSAESLMEGEIGELVEAIDIGFRGMSGAIAMEKETCVGMFVKRGSRRVM